MPLEPSIILGLQPPKFESPVNALAQVLQVQGAQQQNKLAQLSLDTAERSREDQNRLRQILGVSYQSPQDMETALYRGGFLDQGLKVGKDRRENTKLDAETTSKQAETVGKTFDNYRSQVPLLADQQQAAAWLTAQHGDQIIGPLIRARGELGKQIASIPADPAEFNKWKFQVFEGMAKAAEDERARIAQGETARHNKETERAGMISANAAATSAGAAAANARTNAARLEHDKTNDAVQYITTPEGIVAVPKKPAAGAAPQGQVVTDASGRPVGGAINAEAATRVRDAKDVLSIVADAKKLLPNATGSMAGTGIDMAAGLVGKATPGAQASAQLKVLAGALVSKMPKMSGPQSDKDVQLYREMAGQIGDSTLPIATRMAALDQVETLNRKYAGMPASAQESGGAITPAPAKSGAVLRFDANGNQVQ